MRQFSFQISTDYTPRTRRLSWLKSHDHTVPQRRRARAKRSEPAPAPFGRRQWGMTPVACALH